MSKRRLLMEGDADQVRVGGHNRVVGIAYMNETMNSILHIALYCSFYVEIARRYP